MILLGLSAMHAAAAADAKAELDRLFADERALTWREDPLAATNDGVHDFDDRLPSVTPADQARRLEADREFIRRLHAIDRGALAEFDAVSYDLFDFMVVAAHPARAVPRVARAAQQRQRLLRRSPAAARPAGAAHDEGLRELHRPPASDVPRYFRENIANMRQGIADGFVLPARNHPGHRERDRGRAIREARGLAVLDAVRELPGRACPRQTARGSREAGRAAIRDQVIPAYAAVQDLLRQRVRAQGARDDRGERRCRTGRRTTRISCATSRRCRTRRRRQSTRRALREVKRIHARDGSDRPRGRLQGQLHRLPRVPADGPAVLREDARATPVARGLGHARDRRPHAGFLRAHSARAIHGQARARGARAELHGRPLQPGPARRPRASTG